MKRFNWKLGLGLCAVLVCSVVLFLVVLAPASIAYSFVREDLTREAPQLLITHVAGTIWNGSARVEYDSFLASTLSWEDVDLAPFAGEVGVRVRLAEDSHEVTTMLRLAEDLVEMNETSGRIDHTLADAWGRRFGLTFAGEVDIRMLDLLADGRWLQSLEADLGWSGGNVSYTAYNQTETYSLPPLDVQARLDGEVIRTDVTHNGARVIEVTLGPDGVSYVAVKARLFLLADLPWPGGQPPDENVIEVERPLW